MTGRQFEIGFPLYLEFSNGSSITFGKEGDPDLKLAQGIHLLEGENGLGKSSFLSLLSLRSGFIGKKAGRQPGFISYGEFAYNAPDFDCFKASRIREDYFCIFPQTPFFLSGADTITNFNTLHGDRDSDILRHTDDLVGQFERRDPYTLSGGERQWISLQMTLSKKKPVWFLDEPVNNLVKSRQKLFWKILYDASANRVIFIIDHVAAETPGTEKTNLTEIEVIHRRHNAGREAAKERREGIITIISYNDPKDYFKSKLINL